VLPSLLVEIGIRAATSHLPFGDDWNLDVDVLEAISMTATCTWPT
jgi:hypothetical protein